MNEMKIPISEKYDNYGKLREALFSGKEDLFHTIIIKMIGTSFAEIY